MRESTHRLLADDYESDYDAYESLLDSGDYDSYDEAWDESSRRLPGINPRARTPFVSRPIPGFKPSPALGSARVSGAGGAAGGGQVRFDKPVATAQAIEQLKAETRKAIAEVRAENKTNLTRLDDRLKSTATQVEALGKTVTTSNTRVGALEQKSQMFALLPFLTGRPEIESISLQGGASVPAQVKYKDDKNDMLLPLILMGGLGGTPGAGGAGDSNNMMLLAVALMR